KATYACAARTHRLAYVRQGNGIAPMKKQHHVRRRQFLGDRTANSAARAGDKIAFHLLGSQTFKILSLTYNVQFAETCGDRRLACEVMGCSRQSERLRATEEIATTFSST